MVRSNPPWFRARFPATFRCGRYRTMICYGYSLQHSTYPKPVARKARGIACG